MKGSTVDTITNDCRISLYVLDLYVLHVKSICGSVLFLFGILEREKIA